MTDYPIQFHLHSNSHGVDLHAFGSSEQLILNSSIEAWAQAKEFIDANEGKYIFGTLAYELKDDIEFLWSRNSSFISFPTLCLVVPEIVFTWEVGEVEVLQVNGPDVDIEGLRSQIAHLHESKAGPVQHGQFQSMSRSAYLSTIETLQQHIQQGDIYEVNFCQEFKANGVDIDPWAAFHTLNSRTEAPYSSHIRIGAAHLLCGSPELFLEKQGNKVTSRPIKGTRKRSNDPHEDQRSIRELMQDMKERSENIMITDLVRNDLSRTALSGSVSVEELCEVYTFNTVHQMISTITSLVSPLTHPIDIIRSCFPMGSMTGAPKIRAMELIEQHEDFRRGIYSGAVGLFTPERNFTFNVVIRSILYDAELNRASVAAGGAITALSDPESEYEESLLKARAMMAVLGFDI